MTKRNAVLLAIVAGHARDVRAALDSRAALQLPLPQPPDSDPRLRLVNDRDQASGTPGYFTASSSTSKTRV